MKANYDNKQDRMKTGSEKRFDIAVIGEINADLIVMGNTVPSFNQVEQIVDDAKLVMGSSAVIFACGCARLGLKVTFLGMVGADFFGTFMLDSMRERGIDTSSVIINPAIGTGLSIILNATDDRAILTYPGSIPELRFDDVELSRIAESRHLHLSSFFLLDRLRPDVAKLFKIVKEMGVSISLDTNYDPMEKWESNLTNILPSVDIFLPNEKEAIEISKTKDYHDALIRLADQAGLVAIKLGPEGAVARTKNDESIYQRAHSVEVKDTVGAGDSFDAGFVYGYLNHWPLEKILKFAVACGSISTLETGGTSGQATVENAQAFIDNHLTERR